MALKLLRRLLPGSRSTVDVSSGRIPVDIDSLISPLRYDIVIRFQYFGFFRDRRRVFDADFKSYFDEALRHPYFVWFREIYCRRFRPELLTDREAMLLAFTDRLRKSAELFDSFAKTGFDRAVPITLRSGRRVIATDSGKLIVRPFYAGNGCHRLALLMATGETTLAPDLYRVQTVDTFQPLDNTARLLGALPIEPVEYFSFIGRGFGHPAATSEALLRDSVAQTNPSQVDEVSRTLDVDRQYMQGGA